MPIAEVTHELDAPPWLRVESTLMATARALRQAYDEGFAPLDVNLSQASLLSFVSEFGPNRQTRLAERLGLGRAATGALIDQLEERGLVRREPDPDDRRVWLVSITDRGRSLVAEIAEVDRALRAELRSGIRRQERQQLARLLVRLQRNIVRSRGLLPVVGRDNHNHEE